MIIRCVSSLGGSYICVFFSLTGLMYIYMYVYMWTGLCIVWAGGGGRGRKEMQIDATQPKTT